ncbi:cobalt ECF transporter T component CbiQ [Synechococcus sp. PCC 6312]|uniref:cobalt ECF transporter T component CbiQ n=1 Tax=Synechococcus sp. (strain ATCC 27167 / PCC 6312) TaxID=195253 RepID=UPI00029EF3DF|nr:cobalt ECF transporter T component CbiQ [Synechococcus sp. PCC 6312]AFY60146.1 cobalt ABC transporter, permease protein CbiQ [Synechococcus sp. PCC 6312]
MGIHLHLDTLAYQNRLRYLPPQQKLGFGLGILILVLLSHWPVQLLSLAWVSIWILVYGRVPGRVYYRLLITASGFLLLGLLALMVNVVPLTALGQIHQDELLGIRWGGWYSYLSQEGIVQAWIILCRALAAIAAFLFILCTTPITDLLQLWRAWHLPVVLADLMLLMYRFIFLMFRTLEELTLAQQARLGYGSWSCQWHSVKLLGGQLLIRSLQHYQAFSLGLATRGFTGEFQVWTGRQYRFSARYGWEASLGGLILIGLEIGYRYHRGYGWHF